MVASLIEVKTFLEQKKFKDVVGAVSPPGRKPYPPACKPYGLEAGLEATAIYLVATISMVVVKNHFHPTDRLNRSTPDTRNLV